MATTAKRPTGAKSRTTNNKRKSTAGRKIQTNNRNTHNNETSTLAGIGMIYLIIAVVLVFVCFNNDNGSVISTVKNFLQSVAGKCYAIVPIVLAWMGIRAFKLSDSKEKSAKWWLIPIALGICILTVVQAFKANDVKSSYTIHTYANFLSQSYHLRVGGGFFGALIAYPSEALLGRYGTLIVAILAGLLLLQSDNKVNIRNMMDTAAKTSAKAGKAVAQYADKAVQKVKTISEERKRSEKLYVEDIYNGNDDEPLDIPDMTGSRNGKRKTVSVKGTGDDFTVPKLKQKVRNLFSVKDEEEDFDDIDFSDDLFTPAPKSLAAKQPVKASRNANVERYIQSVPGTAERSAKTTGSNAKSAAAKTVVSSPFSMDKLKEESNPDNSAANEISLIEKHVPQQPKPSFFDSPVASIEGKTVRQNTIQGAPSETTYVKPDGSLETAKEKAEKLEYSFPPYELMEQGNGSGVGSTADEDRQRAETLINTLKSFSIPVKLVGVSHGPAVTRYEIQPAPGIKVSKIASYADDIAMALTAVSVRIEAPIPGKNAVGVEVPNSKKEIVHMRDVLECDTMTHSTKKLMVGLGKDNSGKFIAANLEGMPHVLIAGQTGSGKSVCINAIIVSILYRATPDDVKFILIDPKMVELNVYNTIPHLLVPVVTDPKKAAGALEWAVGEMERRYKVFKDRGSKNIDSYNLHLQEGEQKMPQIVIVIDELADLMMTAPRDVEDAVNRLAQLARAAGMHLVIATQRPSVDVITGLIKANIPTRIAFTVASGVDSRTILDSYGAEKLLGRGDMLYLPSDLNKPIRLQGAWVSEEEVQAVVDYVSAGGSTEYNEDMLEHMENAVLSDAEKDDKKQEALEDGQDELFEEALRCVVDAGQASISMLQRKFRVGYARAGRLIDEMAQRGFVSQSEGSKSREVLISREELNRLFSDDIKMME